MTNQPKAALACLMGCIALAACDSSGGLNGAGGAITVNGVVISGSNSKAIEIPCEQHSDSRLALMSDAGIGLASLRGLASGRYALPAQAQPTQLVVMFHGHSNDSCSWRKHLQSAAARGAVALAMDYSDQTQTPSENYGWAVRSGSADSIAAARYFMQQYPSIKTVIAFAISMGGNVSGYALADASALRADGSPLFDYWVAGEGVHNLTEEYGIIRSIAPVNADAALAQEEIERENGGSLEEAPEAYAETTNISRADDLAYLKGVVLVHGQDDGLVPTGQSREMFSALNGVGVPTHLYSVVLNDNGESDTTATAIALGPLFGALGQDYASPFAGHGWEGSDTHILMRTSLEQLYAVMDGAVITSGETPVPGQ
jgi:pimeloyl-ACP methyl ester carboxylesterase